MDNSEDREPIEGAKRSQNRGTDQYDAHQRSRDLPKCVVVPKHCHRPCALVIRHRAMVPICPVGGYHCGRLWIVVGSREGMARRYSTRWELIKQGLSIKHICLNIMRDKCRLG